MKSSARNNIFAAFVLVRAPLFTSSIMSSARSAPSAVAASNVKKSRLSVMSKSLQGWKRED